VHSENITFSAHQIKFWHYVRPECLSQASAVCEKGSLKFQELIQTRLIKIKILSGRSDKDHESRAAVTARVFNFYNTHSIYIHIQIHAAAAVAAGVTLLFSRLSI
jgi:hypothetical protein